VCRFPLQPRIRRRNLVAAVLDHNRPRQAADIVDDAFVCAAVATAALVAVALVPEFLGLIPGLPEAVGLISGGTLAP